MLCPQWQMNTPMRGVSWCALFLPLHYAWKHGSYPFFASQTTSAARPAAALACATDCGMSAGPRNNHKPRSRAGRYRLG